MRPSKFAIATTIATLAAVSSPRTSHGESLELSIGVMGGLLLPAFESTDPSTFTLATWTTGGVARIGVLNDLAVELRVSVSMFSAATKTTLPYRSQTLEGLLHFSALTAHPELGLRYNLLGGYAFSPHVEARIGFLWARYSAQKLLDDAGKDYGLTLANKGEGALTASVGTALEYRLLDFLLVSLSIGLTEALNNAHYRRGLTVAGEVSFPWFP